MKIKHLLLSLFVGAIAFTIHSCIVKGDSNPSPTKPAGNTGTSSINPYGSIPGNNTFVTTIGGLYIPSLYESLVGARYGKCDCDTTPKCDYYIVNGFFEQKNGESGAKFDAKISFSAYFLRKPTTNANYQLVPFIVDSTNTLKYSLTDTSAFLKVTELIKTGKTWSAAKGKLKVTTSNNLPRVEFIFVKGESLSNYSDTINFSGNFQCR